MVSFSRVCRKKKGKDPRDILIVHDRRQSQLEVSDRRNQRYWISTRGSWRFIGDWTRYIPIRASCICKEGPNGNAFINVTYRGYPRERVYIHNWPAEEVRVLRNAARANSGIYPIAEG